MSTAEPLVRLAPALPLERWAGLRHRLRRRGHLVGQAVAGEWGPGRAGSRRLIATALARLLATDPGRIGLARDDRNRPYPVDRRTGTRLGVDVNLSHTEDVLVLGVRHDGLIGVDIERVDREIGASPGLLRRVCHPRERAALAALSGPERTEQLSRLWVCKEAAAKADGRGLALDLAAIRVEALPPGWTVHAIRVPHPDRPGPARYWVATALLDPGLDDSS